MSRRTLESQVGGLEALVGALAGRNDRSIADQRIVDTRIRDQVGLELVQIDVERTVEAQGRGDRADNLGNQAVEVLVARARNVQVATADVIHGFVVNKEGAVGVLDGAVGRQDRVVRLNDGGRHARCRVDGELQLALLAVLGGQALEEKGTETRARTTTEGVEDQETLQGAAVVCRAVVSHRTSATWHGICLSAPVDYSPATRRMRSMTLSTISLPMV